MCKDTIIFKCGLCIWITRFKFWFNMLCVFHCHFVCNCIPSLNSYSFGASIVVQWAKPLAMILMSNTRSSFSPVLDALLPIQFPAVMPGKGVEDSPSTWGSAIHVGEFQTSGFYLEGPALAVGVIWGVKINFPFLPLLLSPSALLYPSFSSLVSVIF